jgi:hypothetical protein
MQPDQISRNRVYSIQQISLATFLGSPLAGCWLLSLNYRKFGRPTHAMLSLVGGILATVALLPIAFVLPKWFPNIILPVAYSFGMRMVAERLQGSLLAGHTDADGQFGSWWTVVGISLLSFVIFAGLVVAALLLFPGALRL